MGYIANKVSKFIIIWGEILKRYPNKKTFNQVGYVFKLTFSLCLLVYIISFIIIYLVEESGKKETRVSLEQKEERILDTSSELFRNAFNDVASDLIFIHDMVITSGYTKEKFEKPLFLFSNAKVSYDQIRIIGTSGMEIMRINQEDSLCSVVSDENLADKGNRYYVRKGLELGPNEIYISKIDLNVENDEVEMPYNPVVRFVMPVYQKETIWGLVVINYKFKEDLELFKTLTQTEGTKTYILNDKGYYLASSNPSEEWGFMFEGGFEKRFDVTFPIAWDYINEGQKSFSSPLGGFVYRTYNLNQLMSLEKEKLGIDYIYADEPELKMVSHVPVDSQQGYLYENNIGTEMIRLLKKYTPFAVVEFFVILMLIPLIVSRKNANEKIIEISEKDALTGIYNRGKGYKLIAEEYAAHKRMGLRYAICFIDVNGLKSVNDALGHEAGDILIKKAAEILKRYTREKDIVCRFGGDEFVLGFSEADHQISENVWARVVDGLEQFNDNSQLPFVISLSHGISLSSEIETNDLDDLIQLADDRMYDEKKIIKQNLAILRDPDSVS